jgi:hypothetical protein
MPALDDPVLITWAAVSLFLVGVAIGYAIAFLANRRPRDKRGRFVSRKPKPFQAPYSIVRGRNNE